MDIGINIQQDHHFRLTDALLIYRSHQTTFVSHHLVDSRQTRRPPVLGPAKPLTVEFVQTLARGLLGRVPIEVFPENILARTERLLCWWTPEQKHHMYFSEIASKLRRVNGAMFPQPALVWMVAGQQLYLRALKESVRPSATTPLCVVPYWNVNDRAYVCTGTMRAPKVANLTAIAQWEQSFFESEFTHGNVGRLTRHPGGFEGLWRGLAGKETFPRQTLIELPYTLGHFLKEAGEADA
jgi:PRTRC genetic system protein B